MRHDIHDPSRSGAPAPRSGGSIAVSHCNGINTMQSPPPPRPGTSISAAATAMPQYLLPQWVCSIRFPGGKVGDWAILNLNFNYCIYIIYIIQSRVAVDFHCEVDLWEFLSKRNGQKIYIFAQNSTLSLNLVKGPKPGFFQLFLKHLVTQN